MRLTVAARGDLSSDQLPALYRDADAASLTAQHQFLGATATILGCSVIAAVFGAVDDDWAGWISAIAFAGALAASFALLQLNPEKSWYDGRAVAESVKTLAWQYAVGGGDFALGPTADQLGSERDADFRFLNAIQEVRGGLGNAVPVPQGPMTQVSERMRALRRSSFEERRHAYLVYRIDDQANWYSTKSRQDVTLRLVWGGFGALFQALGLAGAVAKGTGAVHFDVLGIAAAAALAVAGWMRAKDYGELARAYAVAASELGDAKLVLEGAATEIAWSEAVHDAEAAISREHTRWAARRHLLAA